MCKNCLTCAQYAHQHAREPLKPYPVPTLPWQLVSQDLFELNGMAYLVTVDHYSDYYELDRLPSIQSSAVVQATKHHFGCHGIPHTLITDNGPQFTSDLFKAFATKYGFNHITSSPYWSQSNGRAEAAVKSAKHILLTADDVDLALLSVRNTPPAGHTFSPAQRLFGRTLRSDLPQLTSSLEPLSASQDTVVAEQVHRKLQQKQAYDKHAGPSLPELPPGSYVYVKPPPSTPTKAWIPGRIVGSAGPRSYFIQTGNKQIRCNRVQVQLAPPQNSSTLPPKNHTNLTLPEKLRSNLSTATSAFPRPQLRLGESPLPKFVTPDANSTTRLEPEIPRTASLPSPASSTEETTTTAPHPPPALQSHVPSLPARTLSPPCPATPPSPFSSPPPEPTSAPTRTVTRSGRVIRLPARYSD